eukprot:3610970-Alexandrium_andersonii.AAC.1
MSASLVGSEMCIRDSPSATAKVEPAPAAAPLGAWPAVPSLEEELAPAEPVSYTHLTLPTICSV